MLKSIGSIRLSLGFIALVAGLVLSSPTAEASTHTPVDDWKARATQMEWKYNLPRRLLHAICEQESRWRNVEGRHGEIGPCQILPRTAEMLAPELKGAPIRVSYGDRGDRVLEIQAALAGLELYEGKLDGIWGPKTHDAVLDFQESAGIGVDGIVGPVTWGKLFPKGNLDGRTLEQALWQPEISIEVAARVLAWCRDHVSARPVLMMGCYNGGPNHHMIKYQTQVLTRWYRINGARPL